MRISDWSSDVCSSDLAVKLLVALVDLTLDRMTVCRTARVRNIWGLPEKERPVPVVVIVDEIAELFLIASRNEKDEAHARSEERRVGKECVSTCRCRWAP